MAQPNISLDNLGIHSMPGKLKNMRQHAGVLHVETNDACAELTAYREGIIRVCWKPRKDWENDPVAHVSPTGLEPETWRRGRGRQSYATASIQVGLATNPVRLRFRINDKNDLEESSSSPLGYADRATTITWTLDPRHSIHGLGQSPGAEFDRRGQLRRMAAMHRGGAGGDLPITLLVSHAGFGLLVDNPCLAEFDLTRKGRVTFTAANGYLIYYILTGPTPADVLRQYAQLTGKPPLPPRWAFGPMFCRIPGGREPGYRSASELVALADKLRERHIPGDTLILDYQWDERISAFHWDRKRFPKPATLTRQLRRRGFATIVQLKPAVNVSARTMKTLSTGSHLLLRHDGSCHTTNYHQGRSAYFDFFSRESREWYRSAIADVLKQGVSGWWTDEGEWLGFEGHCSRDLQRDADGMRNIYNNAWCSTLADAHRRATVSRCLNITRGGWAGIQRHGIALWSGDVNATWQGLREQITLAMQASMSGIPFWTSDGGGFLGRPTPELYIRWAQFAVFCGLTRFHGVTPREPWCFGRRAENLVRNALEWRMRLIPYIYATARQAHETGLPMMRPACLVAPHARATSNAFFFGDSLLVYPVVQSMNELAKTESTLHIPAFAGRWYDFWSGDAFDVTARQPRITHPATLTHIPVLVRAPSLIVLADVAPNARDQSWESITLRLYADSVSKRWKTTTTLYEDDGHTRLYEDGACRQTQIDASCGASGSIEIIIHPSKGKFSGMIARRRWRIEIYGLSANPVAKINGRRAEFESQANRIVVELNPAPTTKKLAVHLRAVR